jgi:hypothetical protein
MSDPCPPGFGFVDLSFIFKPKIKRLRLERIFRLEKICRDNRSDSYRSDIVSTGFRSLREHGSLAIAKRERELDFVHVEMQCIGAGG